MIAYLGWILRYMKFLWPMKKLCPRKEEIRTLPFAGYADAEKTPRLEIAAQLACDYQPARRLYFYR